MAHKKKSRSRLPERLSGIRDEKDRQAVVELFGRAFEDPRWMERHMDRSLLCGPVFEAEHTRVAVVDGSIVSAVTMAPRMIRFGAVKVPAMTIGPVGTQDRYRKRGYMAAVMNDASRYMEENGYLVAYLGGIPDFYNRFGYYPYQASGSVTFRRENARKEARPGKLRAMTRKHLPAVRRLYDKATANRVCAAARDAKVWDWLMGPGRRSWLFSKPKVILDGRGRLCGYATCTRGGGPGRTEIVVRQDEASCRAALGALVADARRREAKEIVLSLPWDDALAVFLRQCVGAEFRISSSATGGPLMKVVDFPVLMRRLQPSFAQRWQDARSSLPAARFTLESEIGKVGLWVTGNSVRVGPPGPGAAVRVPQRWLSGLLTGYYAVRDVAGRKGAAVPPDLMPVMDILFPPGWPFVCSGDSY